MRDKSRSQYEDYVIPKSERASCWIRIQASPRDCIEVELQGISLQSQQVSPSHEPKAAELESLRLHTARRGERCRLPPKVEARSLEVSATLPHSHHNSLCFWAAQLSRFRFAWFELLCLSSHLSRKWTLPHGSYYFFSNATHKPQYVRREAAQWSGHRSVRPWRFDCERDRWRCLCFPVELHFSLDLNEELDASLTKPLMELIPLPPKDELHQDR